MASSSLTHNVNHVQIDDEMVETTLVISSLRSGKDLPNPFKDHHFHQGPIGEETPIVVAEQDSDFKDEEDYIKIEPNPDTYKPLIPCPQSLNRPKAKVNE